MSRKVAQWWAGIDPIYKMVVVVSIVTGGALSLLAMKFETKDHAKIAAEEQWKRAEETFALREVQAIEFEHNNAAHRDIKSTLSVMQLDIKEILKRASNE